MMARTLSLAGLLLCSALMVGRSDAQEARDTTEEKKIENIVITATRAERSANEVPVSVTVVPEQQIENAPAQSVDDLLRTIPGINLPFGSTLVQHPTAEAISMRGLGGIRTLVLLDGVPLNHPFFGYVQWNSVPKENISRIEVVRGGGSSLFGSYALGGVIDIITRVPEENEAAFEGSYGSHDTYRVNGRVARVFADKKLRVGLNVNYLDTDGYITTVPEKRGRIDIATSTDSLNFQARADYRVDETLDAYVRTNFYDNDQNLGSPLR